MCIACSYTHTNPTPYAPHGHVKPHMNNNKENGAFLYRNICLALVMQENK